LSALAGVKSVAGDPETKIVVVDHDESVTVEALREAMDQIGFSSNVVG
jgi:copper chaperone CopZ